MRYAEIAKKLIQNSQFDEVGKLLNETWQIKKDLSKLISNNKIDELYNYGINNGALGGKLLGAGGAGFLLFYVPEEKQLKFIKSIKRSVIVPFNFEKEGSKIIFNDQKIKIQKGTNFKDKRGLLWTSWKKIKKIK